MKRLTLFCLTATCANLAIGINLLAEDGPRIPRFSVENMDRAVEPGNDFYRYAAGTWLKKNPVPSDKSRWSGFEELQDRNWKLIQNILQSSAADKSAAAKTPTREVGDFFASAINTNRIEKLGFNPIQDDLKRIDRVKSTEGIFKLLADFHERGISGLFGAGV
ncbi:MAG TPA: M13 family metallopeptidase N-terminal domain-containing protein, partial [Verrucomicrobiae bacterium]|nr:M13 family metallopeptidase N-terminal domain-containing protein [Verrucomicrobiae bacterium]